LQLEYVWSEQTDERHRSPSGVSRLILWFSSPACPTSRARRQVGGISRYENVLSSGVLRINAVFEKKLIHVRSTKRIEVPHRHHHFVW
jgi:hypothetical protein